MYIYKITNLLDGMIYIGKCEKPINKSQSYFGSGLKITKAIKKHGKENFEKEILYECSSVDELNEKECEFIQQYNSTDRNVGYNIAKGGQGGDLKSNHPEKQRIILNCSGTANHFFGKHHTEETKRRISEKKKGIKQDQETIQKRTATIKKQYENGERIINITDEMRKAASERMRSNNPGARPENIEKTKSRMIDNNPAKRPDVRKKLSDGKKGENNPNSIEWKISNNVTGEEYIIIGSIEEFCKSIDVSPYILWNIAAGKRKEKYYKGWTCERKKK